MVKAYLRYNFASAFGVVTSNANPEFDASGRKLISSSLENVSVWNIKQGGLVRRAETAAPPVAVQIATPLFACWSAGGPMAARA